MGLPKLAGTLQLDGTSPVEVCSVSEEAEVVAEACEIAECACDWCDDESTAKEFVGQFDDPFVAEQILALADHLVTLRTLFPICCFQPR